MVNYANGKIYAVRSPHTELYYIGSTTVELSTRMAKHRSKYNLWKKTNNGKHGCRSHQILELGDAYIELIEDYPCENKKQLERREGQLQRENKSMVVNKQTAGQTEEELKEKKAIADKEYAESHKDKYNEIKRRYAEAHPERVIEAKEKYAEKMKELMRCECGMFISKRQYKKHLESIYHKNQLDYAEHPEKSKQCPECELYLGKSSKMPLHLKGQYHNEVKEILQEEQEELQADFERILDEAFEEI
jgi:hypothetical protein